MESVFKEMKINKTPGIDGIPNIELKADIESNTEQVFDACIQKKMLTSIWKRQRLVLILKDNNAQDE